MIQTRKPENKLGKTVQYVFFKIWFGTNLLLNQPRGLTAQYALRIISGFIPAPFISAVSGKFTVRLDIWLHFLFET